MFRRIVDFAEVLALLAVAIAVVMLFANEPGGDGAPGPGAALYSANCASCHGADGGGVTGPRLSGGVLQRDFPDAADQVTFVTDGRGSMPAFGARLSPSEIRQVVEYTRSL